MPDLIERLRSHDRRQHLSASPASIALCNEAADEIERLRTVLKGISRGAEDDLQYYTHPRTI